ncbi:MAG: PaaI family thioesterase [Dehalococcoidia bacterium]|nr:PaaI family thioesterase [Dehalococcoidia bacterium]
MARVRLENTHRGPGTSCFVCDPANEHGLAVPFYLDDEGHRVVAEFTPQPHHAGAPNFAHGGFATALLDEGMTWAVIALAHRWGVARRSQAVFHRPVRIGQPYTVACWVERSEGSDMTVAGEVTDARGRTCIAVRGEFYIMTEEEAARALGVRSGEALAPGG